MKKFKLTLPGDNARIKELAAGDYVEISGTLYTARDQAHKRMTSALCSGEQLPFELDGAAIYYCGPTPARPGDVIGSCGPTTSGRMDKYAPTLIEHGLKVMIGKGIRNAEVTQAIKAHGAAYLIAIGGAAALYQSKITACELVAYPDLGCESVYKLTVKDFPAIVGIV